LAKPSRVWTRGQLLRRLKITVCFLQKHVQVFQDAMIAKPSRSRHRFDEIEEFMSIRTSRSEHRRPLALKNDCRRRASSGECSGIGCCEIPLLLKPRSRIASPESVDTLPKRVCDNLALGSLLPQIIFQILILGCPTSRQGCAS
jgi:hypothetical protein